MTDDCWMTYAEAAKALGLTTEGVRALARRQRWPRRSPNAIGGQAWVSVPADRLTAVSTDGKKAPSNGAGEIHRREDSPPESQKTPQTDRESPPPDGSDQDDQRDPTVGDHPHGMGSDRRDPRRDESIITAVREVAEMLTVPLREQIDTLTVQLAAANERAERAQVQAQEARAALDEQSAEHRRVVEALVARIPAPRRSWWRWSRG
jgi:hypothetical protein